MAHHDRYRERQCRGGPLNTLDESQAQGLTLLPPGFANPEAQLCVQARLESLGVTQPTGGFPAGPGFTFC